LNAAIHKAVGSFHLVLKAQIEVPEFPRCRQKIVVRLLALKPAGHDRAVLHAPKIGVSFPAGQRLPVKNRDCLAGPNLP